MWRKICIYDLVREKSTYPLKYAEKYDKLLKKRNPTQTDIETIANIRFKRLQLTSIATKNTNINFVKKLDAEGNALIDANLYKDYGDHGNYVNERQGNNIVIRKKKTKKNQVNIVIDDTYSEIDENGNEKTMKDGGIKIDVTKDKDTINGYIFADMGMHKQCNFVVTVSLLEKILLNLAFCRSLNYKKWKQLMFFCKNYALTNLSHQLSKNEKYNRQYIEEIQNYPDKCVCESNKECFHKIDILTILAFLRKDHKTMYDQIMQENNDDAFYISIESNENNKKNFLDGVINEGLEENLITYNSRYVQTLETYFNVILIKSGLGTGKTVSVAELIRKLLHIKKPTHQNQPKNHTITEEIEEEFIGEKINSACVIASRTTLTHDHQKSFMYNGVKLMHYKDKEIIFDTNSKICITPDSLIKIISNLDSITKENQYDISTYAFKFLPEIVCIDEITSCLDYVGSSNTLKNNRVPVFMTLIHFMRNAKKLILMDGHLSPWDIHFISQVLETKDTILNKEKINGLRIIYNKQKTERNHYLFQSADDLKYNLLNALENGKKVFVCCDSKLRAKIFGKFIRAKFPDKNIKVYTAQSSDKDKREITNCGEEWIKYDAVVCSPLIIYGVDFSKLHFHQGFGYYKKILNPRSIHQQILRIRTYIDNIVNIHVTGIDIDFYRDLYIVKNEVAIDQNTTNKPANTQEKKKKYSVLPNNKFVHTNYTSRKESEKKIIEEESADNDKNPALTVNKDNINIICPTNEFIVKKIEMIKLQLEKLKNNTEFHDDCTSMQKLDDKIFEIIKNCTYDNLIEEEDPNKNSCEKLYNELCNHCKLEENLNTNFFGYKLLDYLTEYGSKVYYSQRRTIPPSKSKEIKSYMTKARKSCVSEYKKAIVKASKKTYEYDSIIMNIDNKTEEDNYIIAAHRVMDVFKISEINSEFLDFIGDTYYIETFLKSTLFSMSNKSKVAYLASLKGDFATNIKFLIKKTVILEELMSIFFPDGLASNKVCIVSNDKEDLTNKQKDYIRKYKKYIHIYYPNLLKNVKCNEIDIFMLNKEAITPNTLIGWLKSMVNNYFGFDIEKVQPGFNKNISKCIKKGISMVSRDFCLCTEDLRKSNIDPYEYVDLEPQTNNLKKENNNESNDRDDNRRIGIKQNNKKIYYYCYALDQLTYLEILLNAKKLCIDSDLIHKIVKNFKNYKCTFSDLHKNYNLFDMICEIHTYREFYGEKEAIENFDFDNYFNNDEQDIIDNKVSTEDFEFTESDNEEYIKNFNFDTDEENIESDEDI